MAGMAMMLKSFGVDPEKIKADLIQAQTSLSDAVAQMNTKLDAIAMQQSTIINMLMEQRQQYGSGNGNSSNTSTR